MDVLKIAKFAHKFCISADGRRVEYPPTGADGNLLTNYVDDGQNGDSDPAKDKKKSGGTQQKQKASKMK